MPGLVTLPEPWPGFLLGWFAETSLVAAALAGLVAVAGHWRRVAPGPAARHALWLVVMLKLVTPPLVQWPWTLPISPGRARPASWSRRSCSEEGPPVVEDVIAPPSRSRYSEPIGLVETSRPGLAGDPAVEPEVRRGSWGLAGRLGGPRAGQAWRSPGSGSWCGGGPTPSWLVEEAEAVGHGSGSGSRRSGSSPAWRPPCSGAWAGRSCWSPRPREDRWRPTAGGHPRPRAGPPPPGGPLGPPPGAGRGAGLVVEPALLARPPPARLRGRTRLRRLGGLGPARGAIFLRRILDPDLREPVRGPPPDARVGRRRHGPIFREETDHDPARPSSPTGLRPHAPGRLRAGRPGLARLEPRRPREAREIRGRGQGRGGRNLAGRCRRGDRSN